MEKLEDLVEWIHSALQPEDQNAIFDKYLPVTIFQVAGMITLQQYIEFILTNYKTSNAKETRLAEKQFASDPFPVPTATQAASDMIKKLRSEVNEFKLAHYHSKAADVAKIKMITHLQDRIEATPDDLGTELRQAELSDDPTLDEIYDAVWIHTIHNETTRSTISCTCPCCSVCIYIQANQESMPVCT